MLGAQPLDVDMAFVYHDDGEEPRPTSSVSDLCRALRPGCFAERSEAQRRWNS